MKEREQGKHKENNNPFSSKKTGYGTFDGSVLHTPYNTGSEMQTFHEEAHSYFRELVLNPDFACIAAQGSVRGKNYAFGAYSDMTSKEVAEGICHDLLQFKQEFGLAEVKHKMKFMSFVAAFKAPEITDQLTGADHLYKLLYNMHQHDAEKGFSWSSSVSPDIQSPDFGYSSSEDGFFVPMLYAHSGSPARKSDVTMVVFNAHSIFEKLREENKFEKLKTTIRSRQKWVHPHIGDHGAAN